MTTTTPKRVVLLLVPALLALVAASGEARGLEGPSPGAAVGTELAGPDVQGPELLGRSPSFFGAARGKAFFLEAVAGRVAPRVRALRTAHPAHEVFGLDAEGRRLLYRPLEHGMPSGDLVVEGLASGATRRWSRHLVLEAAWSPNDPGRVAYTFSSDGDFGLALLDVDSGEAKVLRPRQVFPDSIAWRSDGSGVFYYHAVDRVQVGQDARTGRTVHEEPYTLLFPRLLSTQDGADEEVGLETLPAGFPALRRRPDPEPLEPVLEEREPGRSRPARLRSAGLPPDAYAFRAATPSLGREVLGDSLLAAGPLYVRELPQGTPRRIGEGRLLAVLEAGAVVRSVQPSGTTIELLGWDGARQALASTTSVSYGLPLQTAYVTQGGQSYPAPGNCSIFSHTSSSSMGYAYDLWRSAGHVLASAGGLVVYAHTAVTCNSCDSAGCSDYVSGCASNSGWGNAVIVEHGDGTFTKYTHLQHGSVQAGQGAQACPGLYLGNQGHTGCTSGSGCGDHLHFQRQSTAALSGPSVAIDFGETTDPLSCFTTYTSANPEIASCAPPGTNVARSAVAWQASSYLAGYGGDKAKDGVVSVSSKWTSTGATPVSWLALDLGSSRNVTGFVVRHAGSAGEPSYLNTSAFVLQTGTSLGGPWTTRVTVNNAGQQAVSTVPLASAVAARYVRLRVTDAGADDYARIPEFEVYATAPEPTNVARGAVAWQASSTYSSLYGGDKAYDGVVTAASKWTSNGATATSWLKLDLGQAYDITRFVVRHAGSAGEPASYNTSSFRLETGASFSGPWTIQASVSNPSQQNVSTLALAAPVNARYVRLYITDAGIDDYARIPELEVYGTVPLVATKLE